MTATRARPDMCPGVLRPWIADDGALIRIRLIGGRLPATTLLELTALAEKFGDGGVYPTSRANIQLRGLACNQTTISPELVTALTDLGLLPSFSHERVRNIVVSPHSSAQFYELTTQFDQLLCAQPELSRLSGRFLFGFDDGTGDILSLRTDLAALAVSPKTWQLRVGDNHWLNPLSIAQCQQLILTLAHGFVQLAGNSAVAPWHLSELTSISELFAHTNTSALISQNQPSVKSWIHQLGSRELAIPDAGITSNFISTLPIDLTSLKPLILTPWRTLIVNQENISA